jgi:hypothetical protein
MTYRSSMNSLHALGETLSHVRRVGELLTGCVADLMRRAVNHDASKFSEEEWPYFEAATEKLKGLTYGSEEYKQSLAELKPAIDHHNANNAHHPEFHPRGIDSMTLLDLMEMLADWKAATERHSDGNLFRSIEVNEKRFNIGPQLSKILINTSYQMGWI